MTFQNLMASLYVEAIDIDRSIAGHMDTHSDRARRALFEFTFGLDDAELVALQRSEGQLNTAIASHKAEVTAVKAFLDQTETPAEDRINEQRREILLRLNEVTSALDAINTKSAASGQAADVLFAEVDHALAQERQLHAEAVRRADALAARRALLAQLELDKLRAHQSQVAGHLLGRL